MSARGRAVLVLPDGDFRTTLEDVRTARRDHDVVAALASGAGWYAALAGAGVLAADDAEQLLGAVGEACRAIPATGQVVFPQSDAAWRPDPRLAAALEGGLALGDGQISRAVDLGPYAILTGTPAGIELLTSALPAISVGERRYPLVLPPRPALHTPLAGDAAEQVRRTATRLDWHMPELTMVDGRGIRHTPWSASPAALREATLDQLLDTERFGTALRLALREYAPDLIVVCGRSAILPTVCGQLVVAEGYRGIRSRRAFVEAQRRRPLVLSMRH